MFFFFNEYEQEILKAYELPIIKQLAESGEFYYQKAMDKFDEFTEFEIANIDVPALIEMTKKPNFSFERWLNSYNDKSAEYKLLLLIGQVVSYFDINAAMKNRLNEYADKRVLAKAMVRQNKWVKWLLDFKLGADVDTFPGNIRNAILFIQNPEENLSILSENYRRNVNEKLFSGEASNLVQGMKSIGIAPKNPLNAGVLFTWILYSDAIKKLWFPAVAVNPNVSINQENKFRNWLSNQPSVRSESFSNAAIYSYSKALREDIGQLEGMELHLPSRNIFDCFNLEEFQNLLDFIVNHKDYAELNINTRNRAISAALNKYEEFLVAMETDSDVSLPLGSVGNLQFTIEQSADGDAKKQSNAAFLRWFEPLLIALKELGGSATPQAARERIASNLNLSAEIVNETRGKTKHRKFDNEIAWSRNYLAYEGYIDKKVRGVWVLTEKGKNATMTLELASSIFMKWVDILKERRENKLGGVETGTENDDEQIVLDNIENVEEYSRETFFEEVFFGESEYDDIVAQLRRKKNIILQGAPGVGKSYISKRLAYSMLEAKDENRIEMIGHASNL